MNKSELEAIAAQYYDMKQVYDQNKGGEDYICINDFEAYNNGPESGSFQLKQA